MKYFDTNVNVVQWSSEEIAIPYLDPVQRKRRRYFPDFHLVLATKEGKLQNVVVEVKPMAQTVEPIKKKRISKQYIMEVTTWATNQAKWEAAREYCEDKGWTFQILTESDIFGKKLNK